MTTQKKPQRLVALDYLRGYFILVIIIDHLYRWPNLLAGVTGQGQLWFNAADGFIIVSGLMIGYIRGYKGRNTPLKTLTQKLWRRALLLYLWLIIGTLVYTGATWLIPSAIGMPHIPIAYGDWGQLLWQTVTMQFSHTWVNFLYLYAIFLAISPAAIWLLRQRLAWLVGLFSLTGFVVGDIYNVKWLQWQLLFFAPSIAGYYLEPLRAWWAKQPKRALIISTIAIALSMLILAASVMVTFILPPTQATQPIIDYFKKDHLELGGVIVSLFVFFGFLLLFVKLEPLLKKRFEWLLLPFGTQSLTAYILHGVLIIFISLVAPLSQSMTLNTLAGIFAVLGTLLLLKLPVVTRFIPR